MAAKKDPAKEVTKVLERYNRNPARMNEILQDLQDIFRYLPVEVLQEVAIQSKTPINRIYHIASFYKAFHLEPRGETVITVCTGTACHVRGSYRTLDMLSERLKIKPGKTTPDMKYTLDTVGCVGACALGPLVIVNGKYSGHITAEKVDKLLKEMGTNAKASK